MKTISLPLAAGLLVLGPMLASVMRDNKERIVKAQAGDITPMDMLELTCTLAHSCALRVDSSITLAKVEGMVDMENFGEVFNACWGVSVPPKETEPGGVMQAASQST